MQVPWSNDLRLRPLKNFEHRDSECRLLGSFYKAQIHLAFFFGGGGDGGAIEQLGKAYNKDKLFYNHKYFF